MYKYVYIFICTYIRFTRTNYKILLWTFLNDQKPFLTFRELVVKFSQIPVLQHKCQVVKLHLIQYTLSYELFGSLWPGSESRKETRDMFALSNSYLVLHEALEV